MAGTSVTLTKVAVYGEFYQFDGTTPKVGTVTITVPVTVKDVTDKVIFPIGDTKSFALDSFGQFNQNLIANNDPGLFPTGSWTYLVSIVFADSPPLNFPLSVPISAAGSGINLTDVISTSSPADQPVVLIRGVANGVAGLDSAGLVINADGSHPSSGAGSVSSVAGRTGAVVLAAADVLGAATAASVTAETARAAAAEGLAAQRTANLSDLTSASSARTNLGLGSAATTAASAYETAGAAASAQAAAIAARTLVPTAVKTSAYTAAVNDLVLIDISGGSVTFTLPTAPADKTQVAFKVIAIAGTNTATLTRGGSTDVFNAAGGSTSLTLSTLRQAMTLQYNATAAIWYVLDDSLDLAQLDLRYVPSGGLW